jgi:hypothetical protein
VRHEPANVHDEWFLRDGWVRGESVDINAAVDDMGPVPAGVPGEGTTVFTNMQMGVKPPVGADVRGHVPPAASKVTDEHLPASRAAKRGRKATGHDGSLVTVDDVSPEQVADQIGMDRIEPLPADPPSWTENPDFELPDGATIRGVGKRDKPGWRLVGHVPGKLVRIPLGSSENPVLPKKGRHDVDHSRSHHVPFSGLITINSK